MRKGILASFLLVIGCLMLPLTSAKARTGADSSHAEAGHTKEATCVILKRMGPADEVTSHLYSFGIRGKQFQFVEGKLPEGSSFHGRLTDHDVRNLQKRGAEVLILEAHYTAEDLKQARGQCEEMTGKNPEQTSNGQTPAASEPAKPTTESPSANAPTVASGAGQASVTISSTPSGADIEIDGAFVGNTPSTVKIPAGIHEIDVKKKGFSDWTRKLDVSGGSVNLDATLEAAPASPAPAAAPSPAADSSPAAGH